MRTHVLELSDLQPCTLDLSPTLAGDTITGTELAVVQGLACAHTVEGAMVTLTFSDAAVGTPGLVTVRCTTDMGCTFDASVRVWVRG